MNHNITISHKRVAHTMPRETRENRSTIEDCNTIQKDKTKPCKNSTEITQKIVSVTKDKQYHFRHVQVGRQST